MKYRLTLTMLMLCGALACKKDRSAPSPASKSKTKTPTQTQSQPDSSLTTSAMDVAVDLVSGSLAANSDGAAKITTDFASDAQAKINTDSLCGTAWTDNRALKNAAGSQINYNYNSEYSYTLNCTDTSKINKFIIASKLAFSGSFSNARLFLTSSGSSSFTIAGLGKNSGLYNLNGDYTSSGSFLSKIDSTYSGHSDVYLTMGNLTMDKSSHVITSGTATVTIAGSMPKRGQFNYTGTLVFNGDNTATLTIYNTVYLIDLVTGTKKMQ